MFGKNQAKEAMLAEAQAWVHERFAQLESMTDAELLAMHELSEPTVLHGHKVTGCVYSIPEPSGERVFIVKVRSSGRNWLGAIWTWYDLGFVLKDGVRTRMTRSDLLEYC